MSSFLTFFGSFFTKPVEAQATTFPFQLSLNKRGQAIVLMKQNYQFSKKDFFSDPANVLKCMVTANPDTVYLAKIPDRPGGILIYNKEKDLKKVQKNLEKMYQIFNMPPSEKKQEFFLATLALKDYTKIIHQEPGAFILEDSTGKDKQKKITPLNIDKFLNSITNKVVNSKVKAAPKNTKVTSKSSYYNALAQNLSVNNITQNAYFVSSIDNQDHNGIRDNIKFWTNNLGKTIETKFGQQIFSSIKSPDNKKIAFTMADDQVFRDNWPQANWNLYIASIDGNQIKKITNNNSAIDEIYFYWSPDSSRLIYHQKDNAGDYSLYSVNADGSSNKQLTKGNNCSISRISPNSKKIAFLMSGQKQDMSYNLWVINPDGSQARLITQNIGSELLTWSPDSQKIAFAKEEASQSEKFTKINLGVSSITNNIATKYLGNFTYKEDELENSWLGNSPVVWFNDSKNILFIQSKLNNNRKLAREAYLLKLQDASKQIFVEKHNISSAAISRNGKMILLLEQDEIKGEYKIWVADCNGKNLRQIAQGQSKEVYCTFSPDGNKIGFISNNRVWLINLDNSGLHKLFDPQKSYIKTGGHLVLKGIQWATDSDKINCLAQYFHPNYDQGKKPYASSSITLNLKVN